MIFYLGTHILLPGRMPLDVPVKDSVFQVKVEFG